MKLYDKNLITLDGKLDEPVWAELKTYSGFKGPLQEGGIPETAKTSFKILPCEDRIIFGVHCEEPDMSRFDDPKNAESSIWYTGSLEFFLAPSGSTFEFYQIVVSPYGKIATKFYSEKGVIQPDPYQPDFRHVIYKGENFWSAEIEMPLTMFYMTAQDQWRTTWLFNLCRNRLERRDGVGTYYQANYSWADVAGNFCNPEFYVPVDGFPMRAAEDALRIVSAAVDITAEGEDGYTGNMTVKVQCPENCEYIFSSDAAENMTITLNEGENEFDVPCRFPEFGRHYVELCLTRVRDGKEFRRHYPVRIEYIPIKLKVTKPEYRCNFYPGQDHSSINGTVFAADPITMKLEGAGIETQVITPNADGTFTFDTAGFEIGDAVLTITAGEHEIVQKIRNLPPTEHTMAWISNGNLVINGKATLRRDLYAQGYHTGEQLMRKLETEEFATLTRVGGARGELNPLWIFKQAGVSEDVTQDIVPCDAVFQAIDKIIEANKDRDFVYYYMIDEPECYGYSPIYMKHMYDYIAEKDPYHVIMSACRNAVDYINCYDWIEAHPYINPIVRDGKRSLGRTIDTLGSFVHALARLNRPDKCIGFMPTGYSYRYFNIYADYPTFDEMICHVWAGMVAGGKTLWSFACHDLADRPCMYEGTKFVFTSFEALDKYILHGKRSDLLKTQTVHAVRYDLDNQKMFAIVNLINEPQTVTVEGIEGVKWNTFRGERKITGNTFELKPYEVIIATTDVMDEGLATYEQTKALVDQQEYERCNSGSVFFGRDLDIEVTTNDSKGMKYKRFYKMFDGMKGNYAWSYASEKPKFVELDLTKVKKPFSKVVVHGFQVDKAELMVRNGGELTTPEVAEMHTDEWSTTIVLKQAVNPECLRLEFGGPRVEIYEIEAF